jgi:hypothetical protein
MLPRMRTALGLALVLAAASCGAPADAPTTTPTVARAETPRAHVVQPWELLVRGAPATGVPRAILARHGEAWLRLGGAVDTAPGWQELDNADRAVVEVRGEHVRLMLEDDDVRLFVWVARADLAPVIAREVSLAPGVTLAPGTTFTEVARADDTVSIVVTEDQLRVEGTVPTSAIGDLWEPGASRKEQRSSHALEAGVVIHTAPDEEAPVLATTTDTIDVRALGLSFRGWREIVTLGPHVTVRGFVRERDAKSDVLGGGTSGGYGYGSTHAMSLEVGAGTCLYDDVDGEVIGLVVADRTRLMREIDNGWFALMVNSPWGILDVPIRIQPGGEPPAWERCADLSDRQN